MNRYESGTPRALFGLAAVAMTAATFAISIVAPAAMNRSTQQIGVLTRPIDVVPAPVAMPIPITTSIEVVAVRSTRPAPAVRSKRGLQG